MKPPPVDSRVNEEGKILCAERISLVAGLHSKLGILTLTQYRLLLTTFDEYNSKEELLKKSTVVFEIPVGCFARVEKLDEEADSPIIVWCKDLRQVALSFKRTTETTADEFLKKINMILSAERDETSYAFYNKEKFIRNGWNLYSPEKEYLRMNMPEDYFRKIDINSDYKLAPTYPSVFSCCLFLSSSLNVVVVDIYFTFRITIKTSD